MMTRARTQRDNTKGVAIMTTTKKRTSTKSAPKRPVSPASRKGAKKAATPPTATTDATGAPVLRRPAKPPKTSAMQAAVILLKEAPPEGMSAKEMIEAMAERKLWTSPGGKTPEASLYASIIREIAKKGEGARFRKVSRGRFLLR
jgi:hypothetical protein|tara:strand:+ start:577 stop:1011 length:435 start_codon:yes stop_codon:yes gene_type:complete